MVASYDHELEQNSGYVAISSHLELSKMNY
jgi:hypothetical protein